jgi:gas vesicle protein
VVLLATFDFEFNREGAVMRNFKSSNNLKDWARVLAKLGLLLTEPKARAVVRDQVKDRMDSVTETVSDKYEDVVDRLEAVGAALQGRAYWPSRVTGFLLGLGVGAGLGLLLAPAAGTETREAIREKAVDVKNKVVGSVSSATGRPQSVSSMPSTGTQG